MNVSDERVRQLFEMHITEKIALVDLLSANIAHAAQRLVHCLLNDGKIMVCGHGGSAANALHFSTAMMSYFEVDRPPLPVITLATDMPFLTSMIHETHYDQLFCRQIQALGQEQDVLLILSTSGHATSLLNAVNAAHDRGMDLIALSGRSGSLLSNYLGPKDLEICVPIENAANIREMHLFILHCFCDLIDQSLFGQMRDHEN